MFKYTVKQTGKREYTWGVLENGDIIATCHNEINANTLAEILTELEIIKHKEKVREDRRIDRPHRPLILASEIAMVIVKVLHESGYDCDDIHAIADWVHYTTTRG